MTERRANKTTRPQDCETAGLRDEGTTGRRDDGTTGQRDNGTTRLRDDETARLRDCETTGRRDCETTGRRDCGTTGRRDDETAEKTQAFSGILRRSQAFSVVRGSALSSVIVWRQKGCRCVLSQKRVPWDSTKTYSPRHSTFWDRTQMRPYHAKKKGWLIL